MGGFGFWISLWEEGRDLGGGDARRGGGGMDRPGWGLEASKREDDVGLSGRADVAVQIGRAHV